MEAISRFVNGDVKDHLVLLNYRMDLLQKRRFQEVVKSTALNEPHLWICSSGSSSHGPKLIALSREALLTSAKAVNKHLQVIQTDRWLNVLPSFHVGGFGIIARAFASESVVVNDEQSDKSTQTQEEKKWNPLNFVHDIKVNKVTLTSLVPTQVFDLVKESLKSPESLRAIVVGGGSISDSLLSEAAKLGWPLLKSYGMTECCSQIATSQLVDCGKVCGLPVKLSHINWQINNHGNLAIKSPSLLSGYFQFSSDLASVEWKHPLINGWFYTNDKVDIVNDKLSFMARADQVVKVNGELVNIQLLNQKWSDFLVEKKIDPMNSTILDLPDERSMNSINLIVEKRIAGKIIFQTLMEQFNQQVLPFERLVASHLVDEIPRSSLGKVQTSSLRNKIRA